MTGIIGIDLGTISSVVAIYRDRQPAIISTREGRYVPSLVAFNRNGEARVGYAARRQAAVNPLGVVYSAKRLLGRRFDDPIVQLVYAQYPFTPRRAANGEVEIVTPLNGRAYSPQEIVALILRKLRQEAESYLGAPVSRAVLTSPPYFNERQRQAVKEAGRLAGLDVMSVLNEPTAAAIAYGARHPRHKKLLVVDLGGGHYDVSALEIREGTVTVFASDGDPSLGCEEWDATIASFLAEEFLRQHGLDLKGNHHAARRLRNAAEEARKQLSRQHVATINLPFVASGNGGPRHLNMALTREQFEAQTASLSARLSPPIRRTLKEAGLSAEDLDAVLLIGGGSYMPVVGTAIREVIGEAPIERAAADDLVALGAALQAGHLAGEVLDVKFRDVTPLSLGVETMGGLMTTIIPRNTSIPVRRSEVFSTIEDDQTDIKIPVLQGERPLAADNYQLGLIHLDDIPAAPRGVSQIEVTFEINSDGLLQVSARDVASNASHSLSLSSGELFADVDVEDHVQEAENHEAEDVRRRTLVEARNLGLQVIYQTERSLKHLAGVRDSRECRAKRKEVAERLQLLKEAIEGHDVEEIHRRTAQIQEASTILNELVYSLDSKASDEPRTRTAKSAASGSYREITIESL